MKRIACIITVGVGLFCSAGMAQEQAPETLPVQEIVESGRGVLLELDGALAPLPEQEAGMAEEVAVLPPPSADPLAAPMDEADVVVTDEDSEVVIGIESETGTGNDEKSVLLIEPATTVETTGMVEEEVPQPPSEAEATGDLSLPLEMATVELGNPASIGPYRLWLASYRNKSEAQAGWEQLVKENPQVLGNLVPVLVLKELGTDGETFFRLQAGPLQTEVEANAACKSLQDMRLYCTVLGP